VIKALDISSSALTAQRIRLDVIAGNIANSEVTRQDDGTKVPYRRRFVTFMSGNPKGGPGVQVEQVREDPSTFRLEYDPEHPDAGPNGYVQLPNVSITMEYIDAMTATRAYEANAAMMNVSRGMIQQAIRLLA
jgi:flagellar basal-body rod protein FlgC